MSKIDPSSQLKPTKEILKEILNNYEITDFEFSIPEYGVSNTNVIIGTNNANNKSLFLRVLRQNRKDINSLTREVNFMNYLDENYYPVPRIIPNQKNKMITIYNDHENQSWLCILMNVLEGKHPINNDFVSNKLFEVNLALKQAQLHILSGQYPYTEKEKYNMNYSNNSTGKIIKNLLNQIDIESIKKNDIKSMLNQIAGSTFRYSSEELPSGYLHDDFNIGNILITNSEITGIVDFDEMYFGPFISCVTNCAFDFVRFSNNPDKALDYIKEYSNAREIKDIELRELRKLLIHRNNMFIIYLVVMHGEDFEFIQYHINLGAKIKNWNF